MTKKIGIIGFGNMGSAIGERIKSKYDVFVFDKDKSKTKNISGLGVCANIRDLINRVDTIILAIKPQDFDELLEGIKDYTKDKLIVSIAAGISASFIENKLVGSRVIRTMPNLPARVGKGMICLYKGNSATGIDLDFTEGMFRALGETLILNDEDMMDAATAVSGSGPGFLYDVIENKPLEEIKKYEKNIFIKSLSESAQEAGFTAEQAIKLAEVTTDGSIAFLELTKLPPSEAKKQVTSKGGTTEAGLEVLQGKIDNLTKAVKAALNRAKELSK